MWTVSANSRAFYAFCLCLFRLTFGQQDTQYPGSVLEENYNLQQFEDLHFTNLPGRSQSAKSDCYDNSGLAQKCVPEFVNAAFGRSVDASNTCGVSRRQQYCLQVGGYGSRKACVVCDANVQELAHPPVYLTDFNKYDNQTWWQSETMGDIGDRAKINLTLSLGKVFDITYIRLFFRSPRPHSFAIYKRSSPTETWIPYQFYSAACRSMYNLPDSNFVPYGDQMRALCTNEFSDISPLTGGNVAFSTLEHRPSAQDFENSQELQEWVSATDIMITLDDLNTFGDEVFADPQVLQSYFYAITDLAIGGRCKCNGHASKCIDSTGIGRDSQKVCICEHYTAGVDCGECLPFYMDVPWKRASSAEAYECRICNCNNFSNRCYFDQDLYDQTAHGGHCLDCTSNRAGPNCERCRDDYYERQDGVCQACNCNQIGSRSLQCGSDGLCQCRPGVVGDKCDRCDENHYDFSTQGCKPCGCNAAGSLHNRQSCDPRNGICVCKFNVEGQQCDVCKPGFFNLDQENEFGCTPCFCYGHSSICNSASGYSQATIESKFVRGEERWEGFEISGRKSIAVYSPIEKNIGVRADGRETIYFSAPNRFLGDQRPSYNHDISFTLRIADIGPQSSSLDVILEGSGFTISTTIFAQGNNLPNQQNQVYTFRFHEEGKFGWSPHLSSREFMSLLSNVSSIKIRGTYVPDGSGFLDDVILQTVRPGYYGDEATWIERCTCPEGYVGQYCESCAPGYRHSPANGGPFASCVLCDCNNHADICDAESGKCICQHNTAGNQCDRCAKGYYGNALERTHYDCDACPCPDGGACLTLVDESVICLECPEGYTGPRCELCTDGYFGDPRGRHGAPRPCEKCDCNGNVDSNAVSNCNRTTGECLKCIYNTGGFYCDQCLPGYFGDALALPKGDCKPCRCNVFGTVGEEYGPPVCDQISGQCNCRPYATKRTCNQCELSFWNLTSGIGCEPCECDLVGAQNSICNQDTGGCTCREGVVGRTCDTCQSHHFGFSVQGCQPCGCDSVGSVSLQCNVNGQCPCRDNVEGRECDRCRENTYDKQAGCVDCPPCYTLVLDAVSIHRERLAELERLLSDIVSNPTVLNDDAFETALNKIMSDVDILWKDTKLVASSGGESTVEQHLQELKDRISKVRKLVQEIVALKNRADEFSSTSQANVETAEIFIQKARDALRDAQVYLDVEGNRALDKAIDRSNQFGQQSERMSQIAREARKLAKQHENEAKSITQNAYEARNTSNDAYSLVKKAIDDQNNITQIIKGLQDQMKSLIVRHRATLDSSSKSLLDATTVYKEALNLSTEASSLAVPRLNVTHLKNEAIYIEEEALRIKAELEALMSDRSNLLVEIDLQLHKSEGLKNKGLQQQQVTAGLLADVYNAKKEAEAAVKKADKTLEEAQETLKTLEEFDQKVQASKGAADAALQTVDEIEEIIDEAEAFTRDAKSALQDAEYNAKDARDIAKQSLETANTASTMAGEVLDKADKTKKEATALKDQADDVARRIAETEAEVSQLEVQASDDRERVSEAQLKANTAKTKSEKASSRVQEAYELVREILQFLENALNLDTTELDHLEERLLEAERMYRAADIEGSTRDLKISRNWQERQITSYEEEIRLLKIEVENIQEIREVLPDGCFRQSRLET